MVFFLELQNKVFELKKEGEHDGDLRNHRVKRIAQLMRYSCLHHCHKLPLSLHFVIKNLVRYVNYLHNCLLVFSIITAAGINFIKLYLDVLLVILVDLYVAVGVDYLKDLLLKLWRPLAYKLAN